MPPKKNQALIDKFKAANQMRKSFGGSAHQTLNFKEKVQKSVDKVLEKYDKILTMIQDTIVDIDNRLKAIEEILFEDENTEEKKSV